MEGTEKNEVLTEEEIKTKKKNKEELVIAIVIIIIVIVLIGIILVNAQIRKERFSHCKELNDTQKAYDCCKMNTSPSYNCYNEFILPQRLKEDEERRARLNNLIQDSDE